MIKAKTAFAVEAHKINRKQKFKKGPKMKKNNEVKPMTLEVSQTSLFFPNECSFPLGSQSSFSRPRQVFDLSIKISTSLFSANSESNNLSGTLTKIY